MKPLKGNQQLRSVSRSHPVTLQALEPKSSPRRRRGLDASTDRGLTERRGEVFSLDILSHRMSEMAMLLKVSPVQENGTATSFHPSLNRVKMNSTGSLPFEQDRT